MKWLRTVSLPITLFLTALYENRHSHTYHAFGYAELGKEIRLRGFYTPRTPEL